MTSADVRDVIEWARRLGCKVALAKSGHYRVTWHGRLVGVISCTPSDRRSLLNSRSFIARNIRAAKSARARTNQST